MKYFIGIFLVFLSSAFAQDCQSEVKDLFTVDYLPTLEELEKAAVKYTYNSTQMECVVYLEGDRNVTANSFESKKECEEKCSWKPAVDCSSPKHSGPCRAAHKRFYYNNASSTCEEFEYGGCQGNGNNYESLEVCNILCLPQHDDCVHPEDMGEGNELQTKYFYNVFSTKCEAFLYHGSEGNANNFESFELCQEKCRGVGNL